jgi:hypothetical protein
MYSKNGSLEAKVLFWASDDPKKTICFNKLFSFSKKKSFKLIFNFQFLSRVTTKQQQNINETTTKQQQNNNNKTTTK